RRVPRCPRANAPSRCRRRRNCRCPRRAKRRRRRPKCSRRPTPPSSPPRSCCQARRARAGCRYRWREGMRSRGGRASGRASAFVKTPGKNFGRAMIARRFAGVTRNRRTFARVKLPAASLARVALEALLRGRNLETLPRLDGLVVAGVAVAVVRLLVRQDGGVGVALVSDLRVRGQELRLVALLRVAGAA